MEHLLVAIGIIPLFIGLLAYLGKNMNQRIAKVEEEMMKKQEIRQLIDDKIGGIHADLQDIKAKIDKLFDLYIENKLK